MKEKLKFDFGCDFDSPFGSLWGQVKGSKNTPKTNSVPLGTAYEI